VQPVKTVAFYVMRAIEHKEAISFFEGRYKFDREKEPVEIFWDDKYDNNYRRFPEEGVRFNLTTEYKGVAYKLTVTYRPSGTGMENRDYNWAIAVIPEGIEDLTQIDKIRQDTDAVLKQATADFFEGLLLRMHKEGASQFEKIYVEVLGLSELPLVQEERDLLKATQDYSLASRDLKGRISQKDIQDYDQVLQEIHSFLEKPK